MTLIIVHAYDSAQYYKLIDMVVSQIVLDGKGIDPDFNNQYHIKVQEIIKQFTETERVCGRCDRLGN